MPGRHVIMQAERIHRNIVEYNPDGVDFYHLAVALENYDSGQFPNLNVF